MLVLYCPRHIPTGRTLSGLKDTSPSTPGFRDGLELMGLVNTLPTHFQRFTTGEKCFPNGLFSSNVRVPFPSKWVHKDGLRVAPNPLALLEANAATPRRQNPTLPEWWHQWVVTQFSNSPDLLSFSSVSDYLRFFRQDCPTPPILQPNCELNPICNVLMHTTLLCSRTFLLSLSFRFRPLHRLGRLVFHRVHKPDFWIPRTCSFHSFGGGSERHDTQLEHAGLHGPLGIGVDLSKHQKIKEFVRAELAMGRKRGFEGCGGGLKGATEYGRYDEYWMLRNDGSRYNLEG
ncbi:hypothetical protein K443DRAFT_9847 [Laccaria amethystina LaAM-08-1]|uniref:Unplaced genomic scaffold K443scaffold_156, whole genome shotgun sequence n=1 Tax=Laccaria amethystina LaAM-08-1 TaxID=1095629 RepID=A0A0C9XNE3_9AGAR|nr:hypothetical protein K443DRAFT_9847 [Laccaria amethystina LaAM-08-1]